MNFPIVTALYAALSTLLVIALALRVVQLRARHKIGLGDGGERRLQQAMRVHANAIENLPLALILLLLLELAGTGATLLHVCGASLLVARGLHAWGFSLRSGPSFGRFVGTALTWIVMLAMAGVLLVRVLL